jgi:hypothetical protein
MEKTSKLLTAIQIFVICLSDSVTAQVPYLAWALELGPNGGGNTKCYAICEDSENNIYSVGSFNTTVDFNAYSGTNVLNPIGGTDGYIAKYHVDGSLAWAKQIGGPGTQEIIDIQLDEYNNIYLIGYQLGTTDLDPGPEEVNILGSYKSFIVKLDSEGNFLWGKALNLYAIKSIDLDSENNIYILGEFEGTLDLNPSAEIFNLESFGQKDCFVLKLNSAGDFIWAKQIGGPNYDFAKKIITDVNGRIYVAGNFGHSTDYDPGPETYIVNSNSEYLSGVVVLSNAGDLIWAEQMENVLLQSIAADQDGNLYMTGYFSQTIDLDPGDAVATYTANGDFDAFLCKLTINADLIWGHTFGVSVDTFGRNVFATSDGKVWCTGSFGLTVDFDPGPGETNLTSLSDKDIYILSFDSNGLLIWAGLQSGSGNQEFVRDIFVNNAGYIYECGDFYGEMDMDPGQDVYQVDAFISGCAFILKLSPYLVSVSEKEQSTLTCYPNPSSGTITFDLPQGIRSVKATLLSVTGEFVKSFTVQKNTNTPLDLEVDPGYYLLVFELADSIQYIRLIVNN